MKKKNRFGNRYDLILAGLCSILLASNLFNGASIIIVHRYNGLLDTLFPVVYAGITATFLFHIPALAFLIRIFRRTDYFSRKHWFILTLGILSAMAPLLEWATLGDIVDNIQSGRPGFLDDCAIYAAAILHVVFIALLLKGSYRTEGQTKDAKDPGGRVDDKVFGVVHSTGIMSGGFGVLFCSLQAFFPIPVQNRPLVVVLYSIAFFVPYCITFIVWRITLRRGSSKIDEKQRIDIFAGSFNTLWGVLGLGFLIYIADVFFPGFSDRIQWYPIMFFSGLFAFSFTVLRKSLTY